MTQNLSGVDRVLRFALAFWWLGPLAPTFGAGWANALVVIVGWIALAESFFGWCGFYRIFGTNDKHQ